MLVVQLALFLCRHSSVGANGRRKIVEGLREGESRRNTSSRVLGLGREGAFVEVFLLNSVTVFEKLRKAKRDLD
jgi:hypothetical protein